MLTLILTHRWQIISQITGQTATEKMAIIVAGVAKLYVGELVEAGTGYAQRSLMVDD